LKRYFTIIPVAGDVGRAWASGRLGDVELIYLAVINPPLPRPVCWVILRVDGHVAGMRALFCRLKELCCVEGVQTAGFAMRTRLVSVANIFMRFEGRLTRDDGDGDYRCWAPGEPFLTWLRGFKG